VITQQYLSMCYAVLLSHAVDMSHIVDTFVAETNINQLRASTHSAHFLTGTGTNFGWEVNLSPANRW
jgi:hypothetical protein